MRNPPDRIKCQQSILIVFAAASLATVWACGRVPDPNSSAVGRDDPDQILRQMSEKLAGARQLTFKASRQVDPALADSSPLAVSAEIEVAVSRPDKVKAQAASDLGVRRFYSDGQNFSLLDETMKLYATVPMSGSIDEMVGRLDEKFGFTPPLAEFVLNDPYQRIKEQVQSSAYRGKEAVNGAECHHLALTGQVADAELWVSVSDHLPRRLVAVFKDREGSPHLKMDFSDWDLSAKLEDASFVFEPPKDAEEVKMVKMEDSEQADPNSRKPIQSGGKK